MKYVKFIQFGDVNQCQQNGVPECEYHFGAAIKLPARQNSLTSYCSIDTTSGYTCPPEFGTTFSLTFIF